jgi:hypothetical protein
MDVMPHKRLAGLYKVCGQPDKAADELARLAFVELQSNVYAKAAARAYRNLGKLDEAKNWAQRAVYTDLYDVDAHKILADVDRKLGDAAGAEREERMIGVVQQWQAAMSGATSQP